MKIIVGLIVIIGAAVFASDCPIYNCTLDRVEKTAACAFKNITHVDMKLCKASDELCPAPTGLDEESLCTKKTLLKNLYPGEYCETVDQCLYGTCEKNKCSGDPVNKACKHDTDCNVGLYCNGEVCTALLPLNTDCTNGTRCDVGSFCYNGNCTLFAQLEDGTPATIPAACKSYYIVEGKCQTGPKWAKSANNSTCNYTLGNNSFEEQPVCGKQSNGEPICTKGKGDTPLDDVCLFSFTSMLVRELSEDYRRQMPYQQGTFLCV